MKAVRNKYLEYFPSRREEERFFEGAYFKGNLKSGDIEIIIITILKNGNLESGILARHEATGIKTAGGCFHRLAALPLHVSSQSSYYYYCINIVIVIVIVILRYLTLP